MAIAVCAAAASVAGATDVAADAKGPAARATSAAVPSGQAIVDAAAAQAGRPYCDSGGSKDGPTHGNGGYGCEGTAVGFDCTTLSLYAVYQAMGILLSNDGHQATEGGQIITNPADLQPGDLVFFGGTLDDFSHAGVYAGNGRVWDALDYGDPVQLHTLTEIDTYKDDYFVGGARYGLSDGTFVSYQGRTYRIAGGAPVYVSNWSAFGGPQSTEAMAGLQWLNAVPANGTVVEGLPSHTYWSFSGGLRRPASASSTATQVDDAGLAAYPQATGAPPSGGGNPGPGSPGPVGSPPSGSPPAPRCVVPRLRHKTLAKARRALVKAHCRLGKVRRPKHVRRRRLLHVAGQSARRGSRHHAGYRVNVALR